jgi:hypothetical protein
MSARKTFNVNDFRIMVNAMIADSSDDAREGRMALAVVLARVLMDTGNYKGFRYADGNLGETDDTRRVYYGKG